MLIGWRKGSGGLTWRLCQTCNGNFLRLRDTAIRRMLLVVIQLDCRQLFISVLRDS